MKRCAAWCLVLVGALVVGGALGVSGQEVIGTLTNFDVVNFTRCPVDDFEMCFERISDLECVEGWYSGWGTPPTIFQSENGFCVRWADCGHGIMPGDVVHFGLYVRPECFAYMLAVGLCAHAWWTIGGIRVQEVPLPVQFWEAADGFIIDVVRFCDYTNGPVEITREYATLSERIPLDELTWDRTDEIVSANARVIGLAERTQILFPTGGEGGWTLAERGEVVYPNEKDLVLRIPVDSEDRAVIVRYTVSLNGEIVTRVINEAYIIPPCSGAASAAAGP